MAMQTDVLSGHLHQSGFIVLQAASRIKAVSLKGTASAGQMDLFSTTTAPVTATYAQSGATVTVTKSAHGLQTGDRVGVAFALGSGGAAFSGNYTVTKLTDNTFTVTSPNTATITAGAACVYVAGNQASWLMTFETTAGDTYQNYFLLPGEGVRSLLTTYAYMSNIDVVTVFYG
jgi:hypothetical protein